MYYNTVRGLSYNKLMMEVPKDYMKSECHHRVDKEFY